MANTKITNPELFNLGDSTLATQLPVMTTTQRIAMNAPPTLTVDYLVVAGGGGGGNSQGASGSGGGAGEYLYQTGQSLTTGGSGYTVTVGAGGSGGTGSSYPSANGLSGSDSFFVRSVAGGGAGLFSSPGNLLQSVPGGSGGGARPGSGSGAASTAFAPGVGNAGGSSSGNGGGGGGGAGSPGTTGTTSLSGSGGNGLQNSITGVSTYYAGGGAGGNFAPTGGSIGSGGSGIGGTSSYTGTAGSGVNNTGSGGAGGSYANSTNPYISYAGGDGGSGIVILRYATADASYTTTGSTPTEDTTTIPGQTILSFTTVGTGTITFTTPTQPPFSGTKVTTPVTDFNKPNTEEGLKIPSGTSSNQPTGVDGMVRNDTTQSSKGSASAITYYNGTNWRYFENELNTSFNAVLFQSNNQVAQSITGVGFQPDLIIGKTVQDAASWDVYDSIRGGSSYLATNLTNTAATGNYVTSFSTPTDGFSLGTASNFNYYNNRESVAYCFKAGGLINKAADFNGSSSYIQTSLSLNAASNSISFWFNADSVGGQNNCLYFNNRGGRIDININGIGSNTPSASAESILINSTTAITGWNFVSIVFTGWASSYSAGSYGSAITANVYLNGGAAVSLNPTPYGQSDGLRIGRSGGSYYYDGLIGQVRVFTSALSASQVTELYNETAADNNVLNYPTSAGCIAAYPLGENANGVDGLYNGSSSSVTFGKPGYLTRNTEGTIESTVSVNNDLGFSIATYTATGVTGTVGHGLDTPPEMIIAKTTNQNYNWVVYHKETGASKYLILNSLNTSASSSAFMNNTSPTSSVFTAGAGQNLNYANGDQIITYNFTSKPNYSKVGSYLGNGNATGPIVTLDFEPAFVMIKGDDQSSNWTILDNKRDTSNPNSARLDADDSMAEYSAVGLMDFNSDGFQIVTAQGAQNALNKTFIYLAFANTI